MMLYELVLKWYILLLKRHHCSLVQTHSPSLAFPFDGTLTSDATAISSFLGVYVTIRPDGGLAFHEAELIISVKIASAYFDDADNLLTKS